MKILVFGITGSIGTSLLNILKPHHKLVGISFNQEWKKAEIIIKHHGVKYYYSPNQSQYSNVTSIDELINKANPDLIVNAVSGIAGLIYTVKAIESGKTLALANKESLVMAGKFINELAQANKVSIIPIDSEHTALAELVKIDHNNIKCLYITCSGGSFYQTDVLARSKIHYQDMIKHPNWSMGHKITCDSNTLINKCFEIVECYHLFNIRNIKAIYHPQSIVHALIEFKNNSVLANMSKPDMKLSIDLALNQLQKSLTPVIEPLSFNNLQLQFDEIDSSKWKPIKWAYEIIDDQHNNLGILINIANEKAIQALKNNEISFLEFYKFIEDFVLQHKHHHVNNLNEAIELIKKLTAL